MSNPEPETGRFSKIMWLNGGQYHCDAHSAGIPFYYAPLDAECAECSGNSPKSNLSRDGEPEPVDPNAGRKLAAKLARLKVQNLRGHS